ncbi:MULTISPECIES: sensor histidine kinase [Streptomyces]|uniref:sensor histidine kinase n=1 Tax=Streptomyces TaxID=1883 RepID=UPI001885137E|nr:MULTISPECIES: HAMP domain-containing sensor histidine kinase [Streptomyces]MBF8172960.1 HAMP domain-containing histidine kinase [Streptomyces olivaceus]MBZ6134469.1 HAMP domain-containing histidine kinase [Streptomyces olivaceus]MBZ6139214.1 HAMP domain-containing histidine kinase [Streptomyces olivaceus]MBZ6167373.1 HAMP domain-containing histidine kinase [Streptomyces olivaceus]MBZ6202799.1 HAMP domain-containing histidine kinase [Streptomyces olivaceus]
MRRLARRFRALPIRARLSLLVAAAVAFAVAAAAVACWFVVKTVLVSSLDEALKANRMDKTQVSQYVNLRTGLCAHDPLTHEQNPYGSSVQLVARQNSSCLIIGTEEVPLTDADRAVAEGSSVNALHDATGSDGTQYRVFTYTVPGLSDVAVSAARPLSEVNSSLSNLALVLLFVAGAGVVGAGAAGLWVARTGLRPVDELTRAVEHVARTEDLAVRIPVEDDSDDEIARLSRSFNSMTSSLASSRDLQQQLIADAGHELRTPLTSLRTNIELLTRSEETGRPIPEADRKALLASVKAQMTELAALIGDLQELSRPDTGQHEGRTRILAWHDVVESALRRARLRGPELTIEADVRPWYVRAEPASLERAVVNILDNAVKFSPEGGTIDVRLTDGVLTVRDHGPGIPVDELPHVFDRFWRSPTARALPGSGLGLSIVARTVQQAGGEVTLRPAEGDGTTATVRLPGAPVPPPDTGVAEGGQW